MTELPSAQPGPMPQPAHPSGVLLVDKPLRLSSTSVLRVVKRRLKNGGVSGRPKVGHAGTLDPLASGLLILLIGKATKLCDLHMGKEKEYLASVDLSVVSPTDDLEAATTPVAVERAPTHAELVAGLGRFVGVIEQTPPAHSAMKVGGEPAYKLARAGRDPGLRSRPVVIHELEVLAYAWPVVELRVVCGKGTYIRSLARDIGVALGTGGCLVGLRRTRIGALRVEDAWALDDVPDPLLQVDLRAMGDGPGG